jgi:hypothetical protein
MFMASLKMEAQCSGHPLRKWRHYVQGFYPENGDNMFMASLKMEAPCSCHPLRKWRHYVQGFYPENGSTKNRASTLKMEALCSGLLP